MTVDVACVVREENEAIVEREREKIGREINRETSEVVGVGEMSGLRFERRRMTKNRRLEVKD